jgi:tetratricopeptide (TPR) repeat protein
VAFAIVLLLALGLRLAYLVELQGTPYYRSPLIDGWEYHRDALLISRLGQPSRIPFWHPPLYPYLLAGVYGLFGSGPLAPRLLNFALALLAGWLVYRLARRLLDRRTSLLAMAIHLFLPLGLFFEGQLLPVTLVIALDLLVLYLLCGWLRTWRPARAAWAGAACGLAALARPNILLFGLAAACWMPFALGEAAGGGRWWSRRRLLSALVFLGAAGVMIFPATYRNHLVSGEWVLISSNGGINFYLGNSARSEELVALRPGSEWEGLIREPGEVSSGASSRYFLRKGLRFLVGHPGRALGLYARKLYRLVNNRERMRNLDIAYHRSRSRILGLPYPGFGWILALALLGFPRLPAGDPLRRNVRRLLIIFLATYALSILLFFVTSRYRLPLLPVLAIPAAAWLSWALGRVRARRFGPLLREAPLLAGMLLLTGTNFLDPPGIHYRDVYMNLADALERSGDDEGAVRALEEVVRRYPEFPDARLRLGVRAMAAGDYESARRSFERVAELRPDSEKPWYNLGLLWLRQGDAPRAREALERAASLRPSDPAILFHLGQALRRLGDPGAREVLARARRAYRRTLRRQPYSPQGWRRYATVCLLLRDEAEARRGFAEALKLDPGDSESAAYLAEMALAAGELSRAEALARQALRADPKAHRALSVLGSVLLSRGDLAGAEEAFRKAVRLAPDEGAYHNRLAVALFARGKREEAVAEARRALARGYRVDPGFLDALGLGDAAAGGGG